MSLFSIFKDNSAAPSSGSITHIAAGTVLSGDLNSESPVYFFGTITGSIISGGDVYIGEEAEVFGNVKSPNVYMAGKVLGNLHCARTIYLKSSAAVLGNLTCAEVTIEKGALVAGYLTVESEKLNELRAKSIRYLAEKKVASLISEIPETVVSDAEVISSEEIPENLATDAHRETRIPDNGHKPNRRVRLSKVTKEESAREKQNPSAEDSYDYPKNIW